jgi:hypothetical protein
LKSREAKIPYGFQPSVIAIDGPLLPLGADQRIRRHIESIFIRAPFHNRCRPGLSDCGVGRKFRSASSDACTQFSRILAKSVLANGGTVCREGPIVEAFPNAFLGVLMPRSRNAVGTEAEERTAFRLAIRADGHDRKIRIGAVKKPRFAG